MIQTLDYTTWPLIEEYRVYNYFIVASSTVVVYDWVLKLGQEIELLWRQRWSTMTFLYIGVRYIGVLYSSVAMLAYISSALVIYADCNFQAFAFVYTTFVMLGVVMIARLHAMYQGSRKMLIFLVVTFATIAVAFGVMLIIGNNNAPAKGLIYYQCNNYIVTLACIPAAVWEILALCLEVWIVAKHIREMSQLSTGWSIGGFYMMLIKSHVLYFAAFTAASCLNLVSLSSNISGSPTSVGVQVYYGIFRVAIVMQMFLFGPRLILSIRQYHAESIANSDILGQADMTTISFQDRFHIPISNDVDV